MRAIEKGSGVSGKKSTQKRGLATKTLIVALFMVFGAAVGYLASHLTRSAESPDAEARKFMKIIKNHTSVLRTRYALAFRPKATRRRPIASGMSSTARRRIIPTQAR